MALDKDIDKYIPGLPSGEKIPASQISVVALDGVTGTNLQAVLEDIADQLGA